MYFQTIHRATNVQKPHDIFFQLHPFFLLPMHSATSASPSPHPFIHASIHPSQSYLNQPFVISHICKGAVHYTVLFLKEKDCLSKRREIAKPAIIRFIIAMFNPNMVVFPFCIFLSLYCFFVSLSYSSYSTYQTLCSLQQLFFLLLGNLEILKESIE